MKGTTRQTCHRASLALLLGLALTVRLASAADRPVGADLAAGVTLDRASHAPPEGPVPPQLMLAETYTDDIDPTGYWMSEKLDGVRAYWNGEHLISRGGLRIQAPSWFTHGFPRQPLDGELWIGRGQFERVSGTVRRREPDEGAWREIRYMVFDLPAMDAAFGGRLLALRALVARSESRFLVAVEQHRLDSREALASRLAEIERGGGEGIMLHRDDARYRAGRAHALLKVKSFLDAEARVIAHLPGRGRLKGMLGALLVEDDEGRRFSIGTGFSDAERMHPPALGSRVTFRYQGRTERGIPRFASFVRVRDLE